MFEGIVPVLALGTMFIVLVLALINKERTKDRQRDPNAPISTLARDGKYGGVGFLVPAGQRHSDYRKDSAQDNLAYERSEP